MITATVSTNEYGQITFPAWFFEKLGVKQGSPLTINFDESGRSIEFLSPNTSNEEQTETKKEFKSGFGMLETHLSAKDFDVDVAQFTRDIL